jgi:very-short-patch-repair endonuclease
VGTAHVLQGDERDVVILSLVLDRHLHPNQLRWLEQETGVFNVSITRARQELVVVSSLRPSDFPTGLLKEFLVYCESQSIPVAHSDRFDSKFEEEVCQQLRSRGYRVFTQYESAGFEIDLVVSDGDRSLGVECDGPSHFSADGARKPADISRHLILSRAGWELLRIPYHAWRADRERYLSKVDDWFATN